MLQIENYYLQKKMIKVTIQEQGSVMTAILEGSLDTNASIKAEADMSPLFDYDGIEVILDCSRLSYISSSGLRIFLKLLKLTKSKGVKLYIKGMNDNLRDVFTTTGFFHIFEFRN